MSAKQPEPLQYMHPIKRHSAGRVSAGLLILLAIVLIAVDAHSQSPLTNGLVAYYRLDGSASDSSTNANHGTINGAIPATDRFGVANSAYYFNGTSAFISAPNRDYLRLGTNDFTISIWASDEGSGAEVYPIGLDNGPGSNPKWLFVFGFTPSNLPDPAPSRYISFHITDSSGIGYWLAHDRFAPGLTNWHHYVFTRSGTNFSLFIDGIKRGSTNYMTTPPANSLTSNVTGPTTIPTSITAPLTIGWAEGGGFFKGRLDDVRIFHRALPSSDVAELFAQESNPRSAGLVAYYPFNGNANDASGNGNHGTVSGATLTTNRFGVPASAYSFNGVDNRITAIGETGLPTGTNDFTISAWFATDLPITADYRFLVGNSAFSQFQLVLGSLDVQEPNKEIQFYTGGNSPGEQLFSPAQTWVDDQWTHVAVVRQTNQVSIYRNGLLLGSRAFTRGNDAPPGSRNLTIGRRYDGAHPWKGAIDEVRLYNRGLTAAEVSGLYSFENVSSSLNLFPVFTVTGAVGYQYRIEVTSDLTNTNVWSALTNITLPTSPFDFIDKTAPQPIRRFYRAIPVP